MRKLVAGLVALMVVMAMVSFVQAEEAKTVTVVGQVTAVVDEEGNVVSATLTASETAEVYNVALDDKGKELAKVSSEKTVKVTGTVTVDEETQAVTITVQEFAEVAPEKAE